MRPGVRPSLIGMPALRTPSIPVSTIISRARACSWSTTSDEVVDEAGRDPEPEAHLDPVRGVARGEQRRQLGVELIAVRDALRRCSRTADRATSAGAPSASQSLANMASVPTPM